MTAGLRFDLDRSVRVRDGGRLLAGGTPPRLIRLSEAGASALHEILAGGPLDPGAAALARRLEDAGLIHPLPAGDDQGGTVTTVVPVRDGGDALVALVRVLAAEGPVIVVDDGSRDGSAERAAAAGAQVITNAGRPGPAGARNTGLRGADTELVAFVDADCRVTPSGRDGVDADRRSGPGWRAGLDALFSADPTLALVAPRVRGPEGQSAIGRYEEVNCPLDLGTAASLVGPGRHVAYLPAAALVARRQALLEVGGFDEGMRFGEDVDLVWRLLAAGWRARYVPSREVLHLPRPTLGAFARQRAGYGSSAPELVRRHGSAAAPLRAGWSATAVWAGGAAFGLRGAAAGLAASTAIVASRGKDRRSREALVEVALRGNTEATRHLARVLVREWLPPTLLAAALNRRARRVLLAAVVVDSLPVWRRARTPTELAQLGLLHVVDRASYSAGMWREMAGRRDLRAILPARTGKVRRP